MRGYGWCLVRATVPVAESFDVEQHREWRAANEALWADFRAWMSNITSPFLIWHLTEFNNNDSGVLTFSVSRNHRHSDVWYMLQWIARNGPGSYGLFYVHDDEDERTDLTEHGSPVEFDNAFRVHRLMNGKIDELDDPFFGEITPNLEPW